VLLIKTFTKDKEAINILTRMLDKHPLSAEEKEAISAAIGILGWASLAESKMKARKDKREKSVKW